MTSVRVRSSKICPKDIVAARSRSLFYGQLLYLVPSERSRWCTSSAAQELPRHTKLKAKPCAPRQPAILTECI